MPVDTFGVADVDKNDTAEAMMELPTSSPTVILWMPFPAPS